MSNNNPNYKAVLLRLRATEARQLQALEATRAQIDVFERLEVEKQQVQLDLVKPAPKRS